MADGSSILGKVCMTPKGEHSTSNAYNQLDLVRSGRDAYISIQAVPTGIAITNTSYWQKLATGGNLNYFGDDITGTSTTPTVYPTTIQNATTGDIYYYNGEDANNIGNIYECVAPGDPTHATWKFVANLTGGGAVGITQVDGIGAESGSTNVKIFAVSYNSQSESAGATITEAMRMNVNSNIHSIHNPAFNESTGATVAISNGYLLTWDGTNNKWIASAPPQSVPSGGTINQALVKNSGTNYDLKWKTIQEIPAGGSTNAVLSKISSSNYAVQWRAINEVPGGGTSGQFLQKKASGYGWENIVIPEVERITNAEIDQILEN